MLQGFSGIPRKSIGFLALSSTVRVRWEGVLQLGTHTAHELSVLPTALEMLSGSVPHDLLHESLVDRAPDDRLDDGAVPEPAGLAARAPERSECVDRLASKSGRLIEGIYTITSSSSAAGPLSTRLKACCGSSTTPTVTMNELESISLSNGETGKCVEPSETPLEESKSSVDDYGVRATHTVPRRVPADDGLEMNSSVAQSLPHDFNCFK